jgi:hypothetical protein
MILAVVMLAAAASPPMPFPAFMTGCWESGSAAQEWTQECWMKPRGGLMMGAGRSGKGETLHDWDATQIERGSDGALTFSASVRGAPRVTFKAVRASASEIIFANPQHDYPQRIRYWREGAALNAEISRTNGSKAMRWTYRSER